MKKKSNKMQIRNSTAEFLVFTRQAGEDGIEVRVEDETVWLTQKLMAALFEVDVRTISEHLSNIFDCGEQLQEAVIRKFRNTAQNGKSYMRNIYNLDTIIVGEFQVNSSRALQFHQGSSCQPLATKENRQFGNYSEISNSSIRGWLGSQSGDRELHSARHSGGELSSSQLRGTQFQPTRALKIHEGRKTIMGSCNLTIINRQE